jgi:DNA-binding protein HU-beta
VNKSAFVEAVAVRSGASEADARRVIEAALVEIQETLASGGEVALLGFGRFSTGARAERTGRNPRTGQALTIAPSTYPRFTAGAVLRAAVKTEADAQPRTDAVVVAKLETDSAQPSDAKTKTKKKKKKKK